jgi:endogenous inhibitor of DNA gyrase (YacG/DUF329 family)
MPTYQCTICGREVPYDGPLPAIYPFCSQRCQWADLGRWLRGQYAIERDLTPEDLADNDQTPDT